MIARTNYVLVGLFVLVLTTALIAGVLWLSAGGPGRNYDLYLVYMQESVAGLSRDSIVKYYGVDVGRVHRISLGPSEQRRVRLLLQIDRGTPIREDTVATLETQGLTGLAYIDLTGGSEDLPRLAADAGEELPVIQSRPSIWGRLDRGIGDLIDNLNDASERIKVLLSDDNQRLIADTLAHLEGLSAAVAGRSGTLAEAIGDAAGAARQVRETGEQLPALLSRLERAADAVERMADEIGAAGIAVRRTVEERGQDLERFTSQALPEACTLIRELRLAAENLRRFSEELERNPGALLRGSARGRPGPGE
jgi:phospholipid/cholesterol/gamma-HCH transport system substrate-binding protein